MPSSRRALLAPLAAILIVGCATPRHCGNTSENNHTVRIRSSKVRMFLDDSAAAARFAPYAAMSAVVYHEDYHCRHGVGKPGGMPEVENRVELLKRLSESHWDFDPAAPTQPACDDELGLFYRVFRKTDPKDDHDEVIIAFRGTKGEKNDWWRGNFVWVTRLFARDNQYSRAVKNVKEIIDHYTNQEGYGGRRHYFYTAGHSLGGGLAQNVYNRYPQAIRQVYAFDPSPVTGYFMGNNEDNRKSACDCMSKELESEARVYRIYDMGEFLAWARYPLKLMVPLSRHIQEVRFRLGVGHSIAGMAKKLIKGAGQKPLGVRSTWWHNETLAQGDSCGKKFEDALKNSCGEEYVKTCPN